MARNFTWTRNQFVSATDICTGGIGDRRTAEYGNPSASVTSGRLPAGMRLGWRVHSNESQVTLQVTGNPTEPTGSGTATVVIIQRRTVITRSCVRESRVCVYTENRCCKVRSGVVGERCTGWSRTPFDTPFGSRCDNFGDRRERRCGRYSVQCVKHRSTSTNTTRTICTEVINWTIQEAGAPAQPTPNYTATTASRTFRPSTAFAFFPGGNIHQSNFTYALSTNAPGWAGVRTNGQLFGTTASSEGTHTFTLTATGGGSSDSIEVTITIEAAAAPTPPPTPPPTPGPGPVTPAPATPPTISDQTFRIYKGTTNATVNIATTPTTGTTLAIASTPTAPSWVSLNSTSTALLVSPPADASGDYTLGVTATNRAGTSEAATITLRVVSFFQQTSQTFYLEAGAFFTSSTSANLADIAENNIGTYTKSSPDKPTWARDSFAADGSPEFLGTAPAAVGQHTFTLTVTHAAISLSESIEITLVVGTFVAPVWNNPGEADRVSFFQTLTGHTWTCPPVDNTPFPPAEYYEIDSPAGMEFDPDDRTVKDNPSPTTIGTGLILVGVRNSLGDNVGNDTYSKPYEVLPASAVFRWIPDSQSVTWEAGGDDTLTLTAPISDSAVTITTSGTLPAGKTFDISTLTYSGTASATPDSGTHQVIATIVDADGVTRTTTFTLTWETVTERAPLFTPNVSPVQQILITDTGSYVLPDPGGIPIATITHTDLPNGFTYTAATRTISWTGLTAADVGRGSITFTADNNPVGLDRFVFHYNIGAANAAPAWNPNVFPQTARLTLNEVCTLYFRVVDVGFPDPVYSFVSSSITGMSTFDPVTLSVTGTPTTDGQTGAVVIRATNPQNTAQTADFTMNCLVGADTMTEWGTPRAGLPGENIPVL